MNKINKIIFVGLIISGAFSLLGFWGFVLESKFLMGPEIIGMYFGLWFGLSAAISFFYGSFMYLIGRMNNYWQSLYPINFGLTLLGVALWQYNLNTPIAWVLAATLAALGIALILYKINATKSRWLLVVLIGATLIIENVTKIRFWDTVMLGIIFICLSVAVRKKETGFIFSSPSPQTPSHR